MKWTDTGGGDFKPAPVGSHIARCIKVIDMGTQKNEYEGRVSFVRQVNLTWELPNELMEDGNSAGKPFTVSKIYTASLGEKANLRRDLQTWRGKEFTPDELRGFDARNVLGKACMLSVIHTDKGKAKVSAVMAVPKGMETPAQVNESVYFSLDPSEFSLEVYESLGKWHKETIALSPEYATAVHVAPAEVSDPMADLTDDIPF